MTHLSVFGDISLEPSVCKNPQKVTKPLGLDLVSALEAWFGMTESLTVWQGQR